MRSRAAILYEYGRPWSVEEFELDRPRAGEVLVRLAATGLCHSDEHIRQGKLAPPPDILRDLGLPAMSPAIGGHEGYRAGQILLDEMITKRYALDEINDAYADLTAGQLIRGVIDFGLD
jgi:Zn-dependent alcohol dehydrogenase